METDEHGLVGARPTRPCISCPFLFASFRRLNLRRKEARHNKLSSASEDDSEAKVCLLYQAPRGPAFCPRAMATLSCS